MTTHPYVIRLSWRNAALSVLVTAGLWGLPWLMWPVVPSEASTGRRVVPVIRYIRAAGGGDGAAWSPVVFPLPTPEGFSKKAVAPEPGHGMISVLKPRLSEASYLEMVPERTEADAVGLLTVRDEVVFRPQALSREEAAPDETARREGFQIDRDEGLAKRKFTAPGLDGIQLHEGSPPWIAVTAYVDIDRQGRIQHVFLDNSCGQTNVDGLILRALLSGTADGGSGPISGRVRLDYWKTVKLNGEPGN
jgi:hypothetical protein